MFTPGSCFFFYSLIKGILFQDRRARRDSGYSPKNRVDDELKEEATVSRDDCRLESGMQVNETR